MDDFRSNPYSVPLAIILDFITGLRLGEIVSLKCIQVYPTI